MDEIYYPTRVTEAEVQAELWFKLKNKGIDARLEVQGNIGPRHCRFDIVIFRECIPQAIIECKSWAKRRKERNYKRSKNTKQIQKYERYGLPVFICGGDDSITSIVDLVLKSYNNQLFEKVPQETKLYGIR